jgi:hypothetical protein
MHHRKAAAAAAKAAAKTETAATEVRKKVRVELERRFRRDEVDLYVNPEPRDQHIPPSQHS